MNSNKIIVHAQRELRFADTIQLWIFQETIRDGEPREIRTAKLVIDEKPLDPMMGIVSPDPSFQVRPDVAQKLMDELWECGLRPTAGAGSAGQLEAVERHLADTRKLNDRILDKLLS